MMRPFLVMIGFLAYVIGLPILHLGIAMNLIKSETIGEKIFTFFVSVILILMVGYVTKMVITAWV